LYSRSRSTTLKLNGVRETVTGSKKHCKSIQQGVLRTLSVDTNNNMNNKAYLVCEIIQAFTEKQEWHH
jgi:hypothetical protein